MPQSLLQTKQPVLAVQGHPLAWTQPTTSVNKMKQSFYMFDKILNTDTSNATLYNDCFSPVVRQTLTEQNATCLILGFGSHHSGKTYSMLGQNNTQLQKSTTDVHISQAHDSRGAVIRSIHDIKERDPKATIKVSVVDIVLDNIRDLMKHVKKERVKQQSILAVNFSDRIFGEKSQGLPQGERAESVMRAEVPYNRQTEEEKQFHMQIIEKEYLQLHKVQSSNPKSNQFELKTSLCEHEITSDLSDTAYFLDKCHAMSHILNEKMGYTNQIRQMQIITINVKSSNGKSNKVIFVDLGDYEKLQTNIIDHQKVYEMMLINNCTTTLSSMFAGIKIGAYNLSNAPSHSCKLTQLLWAIFGGSNQTSKLNIGFLCNIWPAEPAFNDVIHTLQFVDRFTKIDDSDNIYLSEEHSKKLKEKETEMEVLSQENMILKSRIDNFRRTHQQKLTELKSKLGIQVTLNQFEAIIKAKPGTREFQAAKEHKEFFEKTDGLVHINQEIETKIAQIRENLEDDNQAKKLIQENFSQQLYIVHRKIEKLREDMRIAEAELSNASREHIRIKNEEMQNVLENTHAQLLENQGLVNQIITDQGAALAKIPVEIEKKVNIHTFSKTQSMGKTALATAAMKTLPQHVNLTKEESKRLATESYDKLLKAQDAEFEQQLINSQEKYEDLLKKKSDEIQQAAATFKATHDKFKHDQLQARGEIVKIYNVALKQDIMLQNVENGFYSSTSKRINFSLEQRPFMPSTTDMTFLNTALQKVPQSSTSSFASTRPQTATKAIVQANQKGMTGQLHEPSDFGDNNQSIDQHSSIHKSSIKEEPLSLTKEVDSIVDAESLRAYVKELMTEYHSSQAITHPSLLKGETVESIVRETEKLKKQSEQAERKLNELRVQSDAQRRLYDRTSAHYSTKGSLY